MDAYTEARDHRDWILESAALLAGEEVGLFDRDDQPISEPWQSTARRMASELRRYATFLEMCADGKVSGPIVFPSWAHIDQD